MEKMLLKSTTRHVRIFTAEVVDKELNIEERLQWKSHSMIFNQPSEPGTYLSLIHI